MLNGRPITSSRSGRKAPVRRSPPRTAIESVKIIKARAASTNVSTGPAS
ncbi:hypothetical protein [Streptomyces griseoviridis]